MSKAGKRYGGDKQIGYFPDAEKNNKKNESSQAEEAPEKHRARVRVTMMIACAIVFVISAALLIRYYDSINRAKEATAQLREQYTRETSPAESGSQPEAGDTAEVAVSAMPVQPTAIPANEVENKAVATVSAIQTTVPFSDLWPAAYKNNPELRISKSFDKLRQQNRDIVGWLSIDGVLDEPVFQRDNAFYLTHDATGAKNPTGALFLDESCNLRTLPNNLIVHGHNMKEGAMFGSLKKYKVKDAEFYKAHPYITFNTLYEETRYVIFAVTEIDIRAGQQHHIPFLQYIYFSNQSSFNAYISKLKEFSHFQTKVDVIPGDRLLTLATCSGDDENKRLLVSARLVRENENSIALNKAILSVTVK